MHIVGECDPANHPLQFTERVPVDGWPAVRPAVAVCVVSGAVKILLHILKVLALAGTPRICPLQLSRTEKMLSRCEISGAVDAVDKNDRLWVTRKTSPAAI